MDNVIPFPGSTQMRRGWDFAAVALRSDTQEGHKQCHQFLDEGYEPFAVTSYQEIGGKNLVTGQPSIVLVEKVWMKRPAAPAPLSAPPPTSQA